MHSGLPSQKLLESGARLASKLYHRGYCLSAWMRRRRFQTRSVPARAPLASSQPRRHGQRLVVGSGSAGSRWSRDPTLPERRMITRLWVVIWGKTEPRIPKPITVPGGQQVLSDISRMNKECFTESQEVSLVLGVSLLRRDL